MTKNLIRSMMCTECKGEGEVWVDLTDYSDEDYVEVWDRYECVDCDGTGFFHEEIEADKDCYGEKPSA